MPSSSAASTFRHMALRIGLPLVVHRVVLHATSTSTMSGYDGTEDLPGEATLPKAPGVE
jgi:hypothetical protein